MSIIGSNKLLRFCSISIFLMQMSYGINAISDDKASLDKVFNNLNSLIKDNSDSKKNKNPPANENKQETSSVSPSASEKPTDLLEAAWQCQPYYVVGFVDFASFKTGCSHNASMLIYDTYIKPSNYAGFREELLRRAEELPSKEKERWISLDKSDSYINKQKEEEKSRQHAEALKSGKEKINSFDDAGYVLTPDNLTVLVGAPLLKADRKVYAGILVFEQEESNDLIRTYDPYLGETSYAFIKLTKDTVNFDPKGLRLNSLYKVMGRYVDNVKYKTLGGKKTAPLIEVLYIGESK